MQPQRMTLGEDSFRNRQALLRRTEAGGGFVTHTAGEKITQAPVLLVQHTDDGVLGADDFPAGAAETGQQPLRVPFGGQLQAQLNHGTEPRHHRLGLLRQLRQEHAQVFLPELFDRRGSHRGLGHAQDAVDHLQDFFRFSRLGDDVRHAALVGESTGLRFKVGGGVEYDRRLGKR